MLPRSTKAAAVGARMPRRSRLLALLLFASILAASLQILRRIQQARDDSSGVEQRVGVPALQATPLGASNGPTLPQLSDDLPAQDSELWHAPSIASKTISGKPEQLPDVRMHAPLLLDGCLEAWVARGEVCRGLSWAADAPAADAELSGARRLGRQHDVLFTAVNGSDPRHRAARRLHVLRPTGHWEQWRATSSHEANAMQAASSSTDTLRLDDSENRYRDNGELRYAVRSAYQNLLDLGTIHIVMPDFAAPAKVQPFELFDGRQPADPVAPLLPSELDPGQPTHRFVLGNGEVREGQLPVWLDVNSSLTCADAAPDCKVRLMHDSQLFHPPTKALGSVSHEDLAAWRREALPTFNSQAVEAMLGRHEGTREQLLYANDDMFVMTPLRLSDVSTPLFGPVLHFQPQLGVSGVEHPGAGQTGEWPGLQYAGWLLDERFGARIRPWVSHTQRIFLTPVLAELRLTWGEELERLGLSRFRQLSRDANIAIQHLHHHALIELHRQALLWSFFVLRLDVDGDGVLNTSELRSALAQMGAPKSRIVPRALKIEDRRLRVDARFPERGTLAGTRYATLVRSAGLGKGPLATEIQFSSNDGYPFTRLTPYFQERAPLSTANMRTAVASPWPEPWPDYVRSPATKPRKEWRFDPQAKRAPCSLDLSHCMDLPHDGTLPVSISATKLFQRFAFASPHCGDCLVTHLVQSSGLLGLEAFLPAPEQRFHGVAADRQPGIAHLPQMRRAKTSEHAALFAADLVANESGWTGHSQREFAMRLLQRYSYVIGDSPTRLVRMESVEAATATLGLLKHERLAFLCLNDDLEDGLDVREELRKFGDAVWPVPAPFERQG